LARGLLSPAVQAALRGFESMRSFQ